ncbi:MAG: TMEM165/GDT1 family protein [Candidatus Syntrophonatronum acetioxidans]|uniref:GDT1 family protein n=1 Tax=Candidatus Syntrophonatronum acetioxidans TaxID=1795816 RepID=A0A424YC94_9FIRM|nr:MAG: TMEM165/GDT1 family protein [Candidatus Syntrophonatronum acetioxidans]
MIELITVFAISFITIFIADLGDKTQFIVLSLSSRHSPYRVLGSTIAAFFILVALSVLLGQFISELLPALYISLIGGTIFILTGIFTLVKKEKPLHVKNTAGFPIIVQTFLMIFFAELGDKTLLATIALTALYQKPLAVFGGALAAQTISHGIVAFLGGKYLSSISDKQLKFVSAAVFLIIGFLILWSGISKL